MLNFGGFKTVLMTKSYAIKTFGCQMNISDSERIAGQLEPLGWEQVDIDNDPELVIVNTCSIRKKAEDRVLGLIRNLGRRRYHEGDCPGASFFLCNL